MTKAKLKQSAPLLYTANPNIIYLRDGEVVVYRRNASPLYQCRYKLADGKWHRVSTRKASVENAVSVACLLYDEARFRQKLGLAHTAQTFAQIAEETLIDLRQQIDIKGIRGAFDSYVSCIEKYFLPYFGDRRLEELTHKDIVDFELWRNRQMNRKPKASTLHNFSSAWNRLIKTAIDKGYLSENGRNDLEKEMRLLLRDYVEVLLYTGIRHGTESMGLCWNNIEWHTDKGVRYLRLWVDGKTGGRWLIAKHKAIEALQRLHQRQADIANIEFEDLFKTHIPHKLFRISNNYQPPSLNGTFRRLMRDSGLLKSKEEQTRTLYSLRHTYATLELIENRTDIHTLAKQMGNSATMIEKHYSKLTATLVAERLA